MRYLIIKIDCNDLPSCAAHIRSMTCNYISFLLIIYVPTHIISFCCHVQRRGIRVHIILLLYGVRKTAGTKIDHSEQFAGHISQ